MYIGAHLHLIVPYLHSTRVSRYEDPWKGRMNIETFYSIAFGKEFPLMKVKYCI